MDLGLVVVSVVVRIRPLVAQRPAGAEVTGPTWPDLGPARLNMTPTNLIVKCATMTGVWRPLCGSRPQAVLDLASFAHQVRELAQGSERLLATRALLGSVLPAHDVLAGRMGVFEGATLQHSVYRLRRIPFPRTPVNRARRRAGATMPRPFLVGA
jgi:hypothetical protein